jgi:hypothetical protein
MRFGHRSLFRIATVARAFAAIAACCALSACATDSAHRDENDSDAIRAHDRKVCTGYGFRIGAEDFSHCVQALRDQRARSTSP